MGTVRPAGSRVVIAWVADETLLELGAGGGFDARLAARQIGAEGRVIGDVPGAEILPGDVRHLRRDGLGPGGRARDVLPYATTASLAWVGSA